MSHPLAAKLRSPPHDSRVLDSFRGMFRAAPGAALIFTSHGMPTLFARDRAARDSLTPSPLELRWDGSRPIARAVSPPHTTDNTFSSSAPRIRTCEAQRSRPQNARRGDAREE